MLIFPLKKEWYEKIRSFEKTVEYREVKDYWNKRLRKEASLLLDNTDLQKNRIYHIPQIFCKLRLGYTNQYMTARITKIEIVDGKDTDLHIVKPVYAIHLADITDEIPAILMNTVAAKKRKALFEDQKAYIHGF